MWREGRPAVDTITIKWAGVETVWLQQKIEVVHNVPDTFFTRH